MQPHSTTLLGRELRSPINNVTGNRRFPAIAVTRQSEEKFRSSVVASRLSCLGCSSVKPAHRKRCLVLHTQEIRINGLDCSSGPCSRRRHGHPSRPDPRCRSLDRSKIQPLKPSARGSRRRRGFTPTRRQTQMLLRSFCVFSAFCVDPYRPLLPFAPALPRDSMTPPTARAESVRV